MIIYRIKKLGDKMKKVLILAIIGFVLTGCAPKAKTPIVNMYTFEDPNYPCLKIDFTDQIRLDNVKTKQKDNTLSILFDVYMPGYTIEIHKLYALKNTTFSLESLPSIHQGPSKVYEILSDDNPDKSAVIILDDLKDKVVLRGSVAYFIQSDRVVRVDILRTVKRAGTFKFYGMEEWQNSVSGKRTIENMKAIVDSVYESISLKECTVQKNVNTKIF